MVRLCIGFLFFSFLFSRKSNLSHDCYIIYCTVSLLLELKLMLNSPAGAAAFNITSPSYPNKKQLTPINSNFIKTARLPGTLHDPFILVLRYSFISCHFFLFTQSYIRYVFSKQPQFLTQLPLQTPHISGHAFRIV